MRVSATLASGVYEVDTLVCECTNYAQAVETAWEWGTFGISLDDGTEIRPQDITELFCGVLFQ